MPDTNSSRGNRVERRKTERAANIVDVKGKRLIVPPHIVALGEKLKEQEGHSR